MKTRINVLLTTAGVAAVLLTGCVSSKKYKSSQASLQQVRNDSARLAAQVDSLNGNINSLTQRGTALQHSLDSASSSYASQQQKLDYYNNYFEKQQTAVTQVSEELKSSLAQAGLANEDVQQDNGVIYVNLDENKVFKKNSTAVSTTGKQALNSLAQVVKSHSDVNVTVSDGNDMGGPSAMSSSGMNNDSNSGNVSSGQNGNMSSNSNMTSSSTTRRRPVTRHTRSVAKSSTSGTRTDVTRSTTSANAGKADNATAKKTITHKKTVRKYPTTEGSMRFSVKGSNASKSRAYALKQGRVNSVANSLLQNGVPKVNLLLQQPTSGTQSNSIKVVIAPTMSDFTPQKSTSANTQQ